MNLVGRFPPYGPGNAASEFSGPGTEMSIIQVRDFLGREWRLIAAFVAVFIAFGATYAALSPYRYTASADMIIDTKRVTWTQSEMASENRPIDDASVESEIETTKSEKVALNVIERLKLREDPEFVGSGPGLIRKLISYVTFSSPLPAKEKSQADASRSALETMKSNLRVARIGRSYVVQIFYTSLNREKAALIANAIADGYIEDQLQAKFEATRRASAWLEQRIEELRKQASDAYRAVQDFKSQNSIIIGVDGKLASEVELDQLGIALAKARADTSQARAKVDRITGVLEQRSDIRGLRVPDPIVTDALSNPVITKLRQQFLENQSKESEWSSRYGSEHQAAKNLRAEMAAIQRAIWDEISRIAESYKSELQIAKSQEDSIDKRMIEVFQKSGTTRQSQVRLRELETAANTYRGIYETFLTRFTQSVQQQSFPSTEARVVTLAAPPPAPSSPKTFLIIAVAGLSGLAVSILTAFVRQQMNRQIRARAQLESLLGVPCLAVFPALSKSEPAGSKRLSASKRKPTTESTAFRQISEVAPFSAVAEAFRYIKVAIDLHPSHAKVIGIVSALPGEGKTTLSIGFAAFAAKNRARTLLIDADLRNPSMTRSLGYSNEPGMVSMIADKAGFDDLLIKDARFDFDFLPSSTQTKPSNSSDVLNSAPIANMLKHARQSYDYVLVDLPPILPVVDVKAVAHLFDAFILVVEWGNTTLDEVMKAVSPAPISERLIGTVINKADEAVMRRYDGYSDRRINYYHSESATLAS